MSSRTNHGGAGHHEGTLRIRLPLDFGVLAIVGFCCAVWVGVFYVIDQFV
jgi:hypothetical protein